MRLLIRFDIAAKAATDRPTIIFRDEARLMLRAALTGRFRLEIHRERREVSANLPLVTALREQLGLRLEAQREPADVLVIDRAERPDPD